MIDWIEGPPPEAWRDGRMVMIAWDASGFPIVCWHPDFSGWFDNDGKGFYAEEIEWCALFNMPPAAK